MKKYSIFALLMLFAITATWAVKPAPHKNPVKSKVTVKAAQKSTKKTEVKKDTRKTEETKEPAADATKFKDPGFNLTGEEREAISATLKHIDAGTVPLGALSRKWGTKFGNYERRLPLNASYQEYRVSPPPGVQGAGARRIVVGSDGAMYYTKDHYESFGRIR